MAMERACASSIAALPEWCWKGRRVKVVATARPVPCRHAGNKEADPQSPNQTKGVGFPIARIVVAAWHRSWTGYLKVIAFLLLLLPDSQVE